MFTFKPYQLPGLLLIEPKIFQDARGFFLESFRKQDFEEAGIPPFVQDNHSYSLKKALRGLHYQKRPAGIGKVVRCLKGEIWDVAVDIRRKSPSYGRWSSILLSEKNQNMLWVPEGFAHGFCVMSETADVLYKVTGYWSPEHERGIRWDDPDLGISWPFKDAVVSPKDAALPLLSKADNNFD